MKKFVIDFFFRQNILNCALVSNIKKDWKNKNDIARVQTPNNILWANVLHMMTKLQLTTNKNELVNEKEKTRKKWPHNGKWKNMYSKLNRMVTLSE